MDKIEKIRQEIERQRLHFNKEAEKYQALNNGYSQNCYGARDALRDLENFLDTLSEEPNKSLEEEIDLWISENENIHHGDKLMVWLLKDVARYFAEWGAEHLKK